MIAIFARDTRALSTSFNSAANFVNSADAENQTIIHPSCTQGSKFVILIVEIIEVGVFLFDFLQLCWRPITSESSSTQNPDTKLSQF